MTSQHIADKTAYLSRSAFVLPGRTSNSWRNLSPRCLPDNNTSVSERLFPSLGVKLGNAILRHGDTEKQCRSESYRQRFRTERTKYKRTSANFPNIHSVTTPPSNRKQKRCILGYLNYATI